MCDDSHVLNYADTSKEVKKENEEPLPDPEEIDAIKADFDEEPEEIDFKDCGILDPDFSVSAEEAEDDETTSSDSVEEDQDDPLSDKKCLENKKRKTPPEAEKTAKKKSRLRPDRINAKSVKCHWEGCGKLIKSYLINRHVKDVHEYNKSLCPHCGKEVAQRSIRYHIESCSKGGERTFRCEVENCSSVFSTRSNLTGHVRRVHKSGRVQCPHEGCHEFLKSDGLRRHIKVVHEKVRRLCEDCGKEVAFDYLRKHAATCRSKSRPRHPSDFICTEENCDATFSTSFGLKTHMSRMHEPPSRIKCPREDCDFYVKPQELQSHIANCHVKRQIVAPELTSATWQARHNVKDPEIRKAHCTEPGCGASFRTKKLLNRHRRYVHMEPVKCPEENCQAMVKPRRLRIHIMEVHGEEKQPCEKCGKEFTVERLKRHSRICDPSGGLKCSKEGCGATFITTKGLKAHEENVHSAAEKCPYKDCNVFIKLCNLRRHIVAVHETHVRKDASETDELNALFLNQKT